MHFAPNKLFKAAIKSISDIAATPVYFGKSLKTIACGSLVFFPCTDVFVCCGLAGIVAYKKKEKAGQNPVSDISNAVLDLKKHSLDNCLAQKWSLDQTYLGGDDLKKLAANIQNLKNPANFFSLYTSLEDQKSLRKTADQLDKLVRAEQKAFARSTNLSPDDTKIMAQQLELFKDIAWCLSSEILGAIAGVSDLLTHTKTKAFLPGVNIFFQIHSILTGIDRLEVRGRDSAGISLLFFLKNAVFEDWEKEISGLKLKEEFDERIQKKETLSNRDMGLTKSDDFICLSFTYKVAAEIGHLGDNVAFLKKQVKNDQLLHVLAKYPHENFTVNAHTRWASVGAITEPNCHPVDNAVLGKPQSRLIHACLNGDIDNYAELKSQFEARTQTRISGVVTTDTKIIPLQIEKYLNQGLDIKDAFCRAVNDFSGSHAIFMHTSLAPGKFFMAQKGSGQTVFVGIGKDAYMPTSEVYGFVEKTSDYIKLQGEKIVDGVSGPTQGQIFILDQEIGGIDGITACYYDGTPIKLAPEHIQNTRITSRDTDRQGFDHYFLKEISEAPASVEKTLQNKWRIVKTNGVERIVVNLDQSVVPKNLASAFTSKKIRRVFFIGQGTAGIAAQLCADIFRYYLKDSIQNVAAQKASEFSGFMLGDTDAPDSLSDTLVVAITQSGTTTDTNRTVDMVKARGAYTMAIVNRRDSDITFKVDGVLYTSSGRDIEMSVASTKAFYSQIVAGALFGLYAARLSGVADSSFVAQEIGNLLDLPQAMRQVLASSQTIAASAKDLAVTKTYWAVVGSGPNKAAADEIRIKLSELCYKTISSDFVEDKKHIDLSSEPLILVCAAGSPEEVVSDIVKDTAIFKAHKAAPVVIADQGETRFDKYARNVISVPCAPSHLAPVLSTLAGHIWGYHAARTINQSSGFLYKFRKNVMDFVDNFTASGADIYELLLEKDFREMIARFYNEFREKNLKSAFPADLCGNVPADLTLLSKYLAGRLPVADFKLDFGVKGTPSYMLNTLFSTLSYGINQLARPIDAIKHQAKTVTVGTSRIAEKAEGLLFEAITNHGFGVDQIINRNVLVLKNLQEVLFEILGSTLYCIEGLSILGEPTEESTISILEKRGSSKALGSRVEKDAKLKGTKRIIAREGNVYIGKGRKDERSLVFIPVISGADPAPNAIYHLLLLHVSFKHDLPIATKKRALGGKYERIKNLVQESSITWQDDFLDLVEMEFLFGRSSEKNAEAIVARIKK